MADLSITFCGVEFRNPLVLASGVLGITASSFHHVIESGAGGVTTKSLWLTEHKGHPNPVMIANEHYMLNAVGVPDAGIEKAKVELAEYNKRKRAPIIANIIAGRKADYGEIAEEIAKLHPDIIEVNISCPNVEDEFGKPFACSRDDASEVCREVKKRVGKLPVIVKLSPNVTSIVEIAKAVAAAGADGFCCINTVGPGLAIDLESREPILANRVGGISGPGIKPLAIRIVHEVSKATKLPIIGTGGVTNGRDALEMMMAGATLVGVGTAVYYRGVEVFGLMNKEMDEWCRANKVKKVGDLIGSMHE
ncbi:MAG: dihydroorotate dehydrogenase [Candidatus Peregrinibacteria bacterium]|nr:dihydroorotate dehydrogenase [Candidatus Peregrinibacteria bacterium]